MCWCGSTPFESDLEATRHGRLPDGGRLTLTACFLAISPKVGAFSTSRSNLELDESVEDPEAADACSILLLDSLLRTVLKSPPFYTCKATYPDRTILPFIIINKYYTV